MPKLDPPFMVHCTNIKFKKYNEPIYIIPFGDIHRSSPSCHVEKWHEFLEWAKDKPRCYFLGMGDYDDLVSTKERTILSSLDIHDSTHETLDDVYKQYSDILIEELSFMKGRLIGLLEGNHYGLLSNNTTTTQYLCDKLGCAYLGCSAFIKLVFTYDVHHHHRLDMWVSHGSFSYARTTGSSLNTVERMAQVAEADVYLLAHDHKKSVAMKSRLQLSDTQMDSALRVVNRTVILGRTGSFLKAYEAGKPSYTASRCMTPADMGTIKLEITPKRKGWGSEHTKRKERRKLDLHASI